MAGSSSTKKAAKLAQRSSGRTVRFQGGTLFPMIVAVILVVGMLLVVYARESRPSAGSSPPTIEDHWHMPYTFYLCDPKTGEAKEYELVGAKEERVDRNGQEVFASEEYTRAGVHSHEDGLIHWHPFGSAATGSNADLGVFLDVYGIEIDNDSITFPDDQLVANGGNIPQKEYTEDDTKCGSEDGEVRVQVWNNFTDTDQGHTYTTSFGDIHMDTDGVTFTIGFTSDDINLPKPEKANQAYVSQYGSLDSGSQEQSPDGLPGAIPADQQPDQQPTTSDSVTADSQPNAGTLPGEVEDGDETTDTATEGGSGTESTEPPSTG